MNKFRFTIKLLVIATFLLAFASIAQAQATRTWVSGVGDDVNPCSRTAPCKTWAGAISKTAAGGEIDALDPGGFGSLTTTKSITLDGTNGAGFGSTLASAVAGITINDGLSATPNTAIVTLRNLSINGAGTTLGTNGVNFTAGKAVNIVNCDIFNFATTGVRVATTAASIPFELHMTNVRIWNTALGVSLSSSGASSSIGAHLDGVSIRHGLAATSDGILLSTNSAAVIRNSYIANLDRGVDVAAGFGASIVNTTIASCTTGINLTTATSRITHSSVVANGTGVNFAGGTLRSYGDNVYDGNTNNFVGGAISGQSQQ